MCLAKIKSVIDRPSDVIVDGWKTFGGYLPKGLTFDNMQDAVTLDIWMRASEVRPPMKLEAGDGKTYQAGFHVYTEEKDRPGHSRRVYLRRITCVGMQSGKECVIAQEMYVPSDQNAWPPLGPAAPPPPAPKLRDRIRKLGGKP